MLIAFEQGYAKSRVTSFSRLKKYQNIDSKNLKIFFLVIAIKTGRSQGTSPQPKFLLSQVQLWPSDKDPLGSLEECRMSVPDVADR